MKRAWIILLAAIFALLLYPSTDSSARSPQYQVQDGLTIVTPANKDIPIGHSGDGDEDEEEGDPDSPIGLKGESRPSYTGGLLGRVGLTFTTWWKYLIQIR